MQDKKYWEEYYRSHKLVDKPTLFAHFVLENHMKEGDTLIELGCGNGRDSLFFAKNNIDVLAIDQSEEAISFLAEKSLHPNVRFKREDFTKLGDIGLFDHIYSRFTLHSVSEKEEERVIKWAYDHLKPGGKFLIEARGHKNELYQLGEPVEGEEHAYIYDNHYRRFINFDKLLKKLRTTGFEVILAEEKPGFAPFGDTDQHFIRKIALKR